MTTKTKSILLNAAVAVSILLVLWMLYSWFDTIAHNAMPNPQYSPINIIAAIFQRRWPW